MKRLRLWIRNTFGFSSVEANGFIILLPLMIIILFSQPLFRFFFPPAAFVPAAEQARVDSLMANWNFNPENAEPVSDPILFQFDPNTATVEELKSLGLSLALSNRIVNYRSKGGRFKSGKDLLKIYGMDSSQFITLLPHIYIPGRPEKEAEKSKKTNSYNKKGAFESINLNNADTSQLTSLRGIGPVLARRIVKYREKLGGFWNVEQLKEVYGLDTALVTTIMTKIYIEQDYLPRQHDINKSTEKELSNHPYIRSKLAKTIVAYRYQHGSFTEIDDLLKIDLIDPQVLNKIRPYLKTEP